MFVKSITIFVLMMAAAAYVKADETKPGQLRISGEATVSAEPDEGYVTVAVSLRGDTPSEALTMNTEKMETLYKTLDQMGVKKKDIQTSNFSLQPFYKTVEREQVQDGYVVMNQVTVTICELENFGKILDALVVGGVNRVSNISFGTSKAKLKKDEAMVGAVVDALDQTRLVLNTMNHHAVRIVSVSPRRSRMMMESTYSKNRLAPGSSGDVPLSGGLLNFHAEVDIVVEFVPVAGGQNRIDGPQIPKGDE